MNEQIFLQRDEIAMASQQINAFDLTSRFTPWLSERNPIGSSRRSKPACARHSPCCSDVSDVSSQKAASFVDRAGRYEVIQRLNVMTDEGVKCS